VIEQLRTEGRDLILVTHHMALARRVADRVAFLADGRTRSFLAKVLKF
jgi:polar amino acid transport system ATP-binding protein